MSTEWLYCMLSLFQDKECAMSMILLFATIKYDIDKYLSHKQCTKIDNHSQLTCFIMVMVTFLIPAL